MHEHGSSDDNADCLRYLEGKADSYTIQKAVERKAAGTQYPPPRMIMTLTIVMGMDEHKPIKDEVNRKAQAYDVGNEANIVRALSKLDGLGQYLKERDRDNCPGAKAQDQVQLVLEA